MNPNLEGDVCAKCVFMDVRKETLCRGFWSASFPCTDDGMRRDYFRKPCPKYVPVRDMDARINLLNKIL